MQHSEEYGYYTFRRAEEVERGNQATHPAAAAAHYELAYRYGILSCRKISSTPGMFHVVLEAA